jgi:Flp pilus assembly protein TadD
MLDASQTLDPASVGLVRDLVNRDRFAGYAARELHQFGLDGAVSVVQQRTVCLFPRHPDLRFLGRAAEQLLPVRADLEFRLVQSRVVLYRHGLDDRRDSVAWARRHVPLLERSVRESPEEPFHLYNLGLALNRLGVYVEAESALRRAIKLSARRAIWRAPAFTALARTVAAQGRGVEATKLCRVATELAPEWPGAWCMLGEALSDVGRSDEALDAYRRALDCGDEAMRPGDASGDTAWQVRAGLARIHLAREEYAAAADCLSVATSINPMNGELYSMLARAADGAGRPGEVRRQLERAVMATRAGADAYLSLGDFFTKKAEEALLRGLVDNAENPLLRERIERLREARGA